MSRKVYYIGLRLVLGTAKRYIQRNQLNIQANVSPEAYTCVLDTLTAILSCLELLPVNAPV
jgi:hypothetical protein